MKIKKRYFAIFIIILINFSVSGQTDAFTNEVEHKDDKVYFNNKLFSGTLYSEEDGIPNDCDCTLKASYKNGKLHGIKRIWYKTGKIKEKAKYYNGTILEKTLYYPNGKPKKKEKYKNGKIVSSVLYNKDGTIKKSITDDNNVIVTGNPEKPKQNITENNMPNTAKNSTIITAQTRDLPKTEGLSYVYFPNGQKKQAKFYKNGLLVKDSIFNDKGILITAKKFEDGELIHIEEYYSSGNLHKVNNYLYNKKNGTQKEFYENQNPKIIEIYEQGDLTKREVYNEEGKLLEENNFRLKKKHGLQKKYNETGKLTDLEEYNMGTLIRKERYTDTGTEKIKIDNNLSEIKTYDARDKLISLRYEILPDKIKDSLYITYDAKTGFKITEIAYNKGKIIREGSYKNNKEEGLWKYYWIDGTKEVKKIYKDGVLVSEEILTYAKQLKNNYNQGDLLYARIVSTPKKQLQLILVKMDHSEDDNNIKLIRKAIKETLNYELDKIANQAQYEDKELYAVLKFDEFKFKFKSKKNKNKKFIAYIKFNVEQKNYFKEDSNNKLLVISPLENKFLKDKNEAFQNTIDNLRIKVSNYIQNNFPYTGTMFKIIEQNKSEIKKVAVYFDKMGNIDKKSILTVVDDKNNHLAQLKVLQKQSRIVICEVINGKKELKSYISIKPKPFVKYFPYNKN